MDDMHCYIIEYNPDVIMITESWTRETIDNVMLQIEGYQLMRRDRQQRIGGGCLLYYKSHLRCVQVPNQRDTETLWCELSLGGEKVTFGVCYRSPAAPIEEVQSLFEDIRDTCTRQGEKIVVGDFNFGSIDWDTLHSGNDARDFVDLIQDCFLTQVVKKPTRGENILDLVLTSNESLVGNVNVAEPFGTSDHNVITFDVNLSADCTNWQEEYMDYRHGDYKRLRQLISSVNWPLCMKGGTENMWKVFISTLNRLLTQCIPKRRRQKKRQPWWWNKQVVRARKNKIALWKRYKITSDHDDFLQYRRALNRATKEVRNAKLQMERRIMNKAKKDPKAFHGYVRRNTKVKDMVGPLTNEDGTVITEDSVTAQVLNDYFSSVFTVESMENMPEAAQIFTGRDDAKLDHVDFSITGIKKCINRLKPGKAPGEDGILSTVLKETANEIALPLSLLFTRSWIEGVVPNDWKKANVTPIFKSGKRDAAKNYRPVSLTSQICKLMETIIRDSIVEHLENHQLVKQSQHGFRRGHSCLTNLLTFLERVTQWIDEGKPVDVIYLDYSKAFDKVAHARLLMKIKAHGIGEKMARWIEQWLDNRVQRVVVKGSASEWSSVTSGVPQGSVLGPTLFILYVNDIEENITSSVLKFADDTKIFYPVDRSEASFTLQDDLHNLSTWSSKWQMLFNVDKCGCMHLGYGNPHYDYFLDDTVMRSVEEEKDLGVIMHSSLKFSQHCASAVKKANRVLGIIKKNFKSRDKEFILKMYKSLVRPHLDYCSQVWRPYHQRDIDLIENVQKRTLKLIHGYKELNYEEQLRRARLTTLECRRLRGDLLETFKILRGFENVDKDDFFTCADNTRRGHNFKLYKERSRLDCRKYFFSQRIVNTWNRLPETAVNAQSVNVFKSQVDKFLRNVGGLYISLSRLPAPIP
jgi:hypothetical protein